MCTQYDIRIAYKHYVHHGTDLRLPGCVAASTAAMATAACCGDDESSTR